jgi:hypothetical protein
MSTMKLLKYFFFFPTLYINEAGELTDYSKDKFYH